MNGKGLRGYNRVGIPVSLTSNLSLAGAAGYGFTESMGSQDGTHHRLLGKVGVGAALLRYLAVALHLDGRYDIHPDDEDGKDTSLAGDPRLTLRGGYPFGRLFQLGAEVVAWVPGGDAPSMDWVATTVDAQLLAALAATDRPWSIAVLAGFRFDNSANSSPDLNRLREGDRIVLGISDFNSVLAGLGGAYRFLGFEVFGEVSADILVGSGAPSFATSPLRAGLGIRHTFIQSLKLELLAEAALSKRPGVAPADPLIPIEPRFSVAVGLSYTWSFADEKEIEPASVPAPEPALRPAPPAPAPEPTTVTISGTIVGDEDEPVSGATVTLTVGEVNMETETDPRGGYSFENVPFGEAKLTATAEDFETLEWTVTVTPEMQPVESQRMTQAERGSQLRGLVRSFRGEGIQASITVKPLGLKTTSDKDGFFEVDVPPGRYTVIIEAPRYRRQRRKVEVEQNSVTILNVDLRKKK